MMMSSSFFGENGVALGSCVHSVMRPSPEGVFLFVRGKSRCYLISCRVSQRHLMFDLSDWAMGARTASQTQDTTPRHHAKPTCCLVQCLRKRRYPKPAPTARMVVLHVFAVPRELIKPFNSDSISIIANFSKLRREEQNLSIRKKACPPRL